MRYTGNDPKIKSRAKWTEMQKTYLVTLLKEHNNPRFRAQNGWTKEAWFNISKAMNAKFPTAQLQMDQIKDQEQQLKRAFRLVKSLTELSGFGWDATTNMVSAPQNVWEPILEVS